MTPYEQLALIVAEQKTEIERLRAALEQILGLNWDQFASDLPVGEALDIARNALV